MKLYGHPLSGHSHRVKALLGVLGASYEDITVDLSGGAHKQATFLGLNPLGQVPVLDDDGFVLRDSSAILVYLAHKLDPQGHWLPMDAAGHGEVQQWLSTAVNEVRTGPFALRAVRLFGASFDADLATTQTEQLLGDLFEPHLAERSWLVGDRPTIADLACYSSIARVTEGGFDLARYPAVCAWLTRVEALDGFAPMVHASDLEAS